MKLKKIIIDVVVITFAFILFTVWYRNSIGGTTQTSSSFLKHFKIYLITTDKEYQYWDYLNQGAADMAASLGVDYIWDAPAKRDVNQQIDIINKAIEDGAYALLIAADDPKLISAPVEDAKAKSIKVIYVDSPAYEEAITTLATDNYEAGVVAGQQMISELNNAGISHGSIGIVSVESKANSDLRDKGFRDALSSDGRFAILDTVYTNGNPSEAQDAAERLISDHSDLVGLYGTNEGTSEGVGFANKANSNRYIGIGYDKTDVMMQLLRDGNLKVIINQNPYTMGYLGMAQAVAAILGKDTGPDFIDTGVTVLRK